MKTLLTILMLLISSVALSAPTIEEYVEQGTAVKSKDPTETNTYYAIKVYGTTWPISGYHYDSKLDVHFIHFESGALMDGSVLSCQVGFHYRLKTADIICTGEYDPPTIHIFRIVGTRK